MSAGDLVVIFLATAAGATVKGATGIGLPLVATPLMSLVIGVENAVVAIAIPNLASNALIVWTQREHRGVVGSLRSFLAVGVVASLFGAAVLTQLDERWLMLALATVVTSFLTWRLLAKNPVWSPAVRRRGRLPVATVAGLAQGSIGISGPIIAPWFQGHGLRREAFMYGNSIVFLWSGAAQIAGLTLAAAWTSDRLLGAVVCGAAVALVQPLAARWGRGLDQRRFELAVTGVLVIAVASLIVRAI